MNTQAADNSTTGGGGAPVGNRNALRHGLRGATLPAPYSYVQKSIDAFRRSLEASVLDLKGQVDVTDACAISTAHRFERAAQIYQAMAAAGVDGRGDPLAQADLIRAWELAAKASEGRDKAVARLGIDAKQKQADAGDWLTLVEQGGQK